MTTSASGTAAIILRWDISRCSWRMRCLTSGRPSWSLCSSRTSCLVISSFLWLSHSWIGASTAAMMINPQAIHSALQPTTCTLWMIADSSGSWAMRSKSSMSDDNTVSATNRIRMNFANALSSSKALVELLKALAKFILILFVALTVLSSDIDDLLRIAHEPLESAIIHSVQVVGWSALWMACGLIIIAAVDAPIQLWESHKKLLMTKQEVRDEHKDQEGRPEVKQRIRQLQREMSQRKMMAAVPDADVVITNPTHYAVALKYDPEKGGAPMLLAKGSDFTALKIREIAVANDILLMESPELARSIFYSTDLDQEIPAGLYLAVAQVLAYVYQIRQYRAGKGKRPDPLKDLPIPPDLRRDS